ncbi:MAG: hypothetical protein DMG96_06825 [Acidobacteria bacterium]|nr:MAG: hypothetical protein DMG96_06825 [Acidobacteriota bacterium]
MSILSRDADETSSWQRGRLPSTQHDHNSRDCNSVSLIFALTTERNGRIRTWSLQLLPNEGPPGIFGDKLTELPRPK